MSRQGITKKHGESSIDAAAYCFRKNSGQQVTEELMKPDMDLVFEMLDRKIRVHDLIDKLNSIPGDLELDSFLRWYHNRK